MDGHLGVADCRQPRRRESVVPLQEARGLVDAKRDADQARGLLHRRRVGERRQRGAKHFCVQPWFDEKSSMSLLLLTIYIKKKKNRSAASGPPYRYYFSRQVAPALPAGLAMAGDGLAAYRCARTRAPAARCLS